MEKLEDIILHKLMNPSERITKTAATLKVEAAEPAYVFDEKTCFDDLHLNISVMERTRTNLAHRHIYSHRKIIGKAIVFGKKVVRKFLKWYINPFAEQQIAFNNGARYGIGRLTQIVTELFARSEKVKTFQESAEVELDRLGDQMACFAMKFEELEVQKSAESAAAEENRRKLLLLGTIVEKQAEEQAAVEQKFADVKNCLESMVSEQYAEKLHQIEMLQLKLAEQEVEQIRGQTQAEEQIEMLQSQLTEQENCRRNEQREANQQMENLAQRLADLEERLATGKVDRQKSFLPFAEQTTNSQSGEDSIAAYIALELGYQPQDVTYLDLGANHAKDMSNTYRFYQYGARGVLVEANPELIPELKKYRSGDIIINKCISAKDGDVVDFFVMNGDGLSTKNENSANSAVDINPNIFIKDKISIETISVNTLIERYFNQAPVLLNVDLEGCEMEVLPSIDFEKYRPLIIIVETIPYSTNLVVGQKNTEVIDFLNRKGYTEYAFTGINSIFIDRTKLQ